MKPIISIIVTLKNTRQHHRELSRISDFLSSLEAQTAHDKIEAVISDLDSDEYYKKKHQILIKKYHRIPIRHIYTETGQSWNISRARNIGIRNARGQYLMMVDVDCIFAPNFIESVIETIDNDVIIHCRVWELPQGFKDKIVDFEAAKKISTLRPKHGYGTCQIVSRKWAESVHGYDEEYITWGAEDTDFYYRAIQSGKKSIWIEDKTDYFHRWHSQGNRDENKTWLTQNRERLQLTIGEKLPVVRNWDGWGEQKKQQEMNNVAILVTTFLRDEYLFRCIDSIRKYYPGIPIYIGDNGQHTNEKRQFCRDNNCEYLELPFDCGVGETRNESIKRLPDNMEYLIIVEDDCVFTKETKLEKWYQVLQKDSKIGIVGGLLKRADDTEQHYEGYHKIEGRTKFADKVTNPVWYEIGGIRLFYCDLILNVFMMRLDVWRGGSGICKEPIQWDPQFKTVLEHTDFFMNVKYQITKKGIIRRKKAWGIAYTPDVWAYHIHKAQTQEYTRYRRRTAGYEIFGKKWGLDYSYSDYNHENPIIYNPKVKKKPKFFVQDLILSTTVNILNKHKVKWWLASGSCLGAVREGDYIEHDTDIDIGIAPDQEWVWELLLEELGKKCFALYKDWYHKDQKIELTFKKYGTKIDFFFYKKKGQRLWYGAFGPDKMGRWGTFMEFLPRSFPKKIFENPKKIKFRGVDCYLPGQPERFVESMYGKDWRTPKKNWKYWQDCKALDMSLTDRAIKVFIFDGWDSMGDKERQLLREARKLGNKLIVGILTDDALERGNIPFKHPFNKRIERLKRLRSVDEIMSINSVAFARDLQKTGHIPDYFVAFKGENSGSVGYLETFGCQVVPVEDVARMTRKRKPLKKRSNKIAIAIKTFLREDNFFRTVEAIRQNVPFPYKLYIADDGRVSDDKQEFYEGLTDEGHKIIKLSHGVGISSGRNAILREVKEDYVLIMDDDIQINDPKTIVNMKRVLDSNNDIGIVAGVLRHEISEKTFGNDNYSRGIDLKIDRGALFRSSTRNPKRKIGKITYRESDQVVNFFLAKAEVFDSIKWDSQIKVEYEHMDFFLELKKTKWKAAVCFDAVATHLHSMPHDMEYARYRRSAPKDYFYKKHGIGNIINSWATERRLCQIGK